MRSKLSLKSGIDLAAMVDIVFLLVAYFLINATLANNPAIKIELPKSITAKTKLKKNIVISVDKNNKVYLNNKQVTLRKLPVELKKILKTSDKDNVIIKGDQKSHYKTIVAVMDYVHQAGITHFNLATDPK